MRKEIIILLYCLFTPFLIYAMDVCDDEISPNTNCVVITPVIDCSSYSYDLVNLTSGNNTLDVDDGTLVQIGSTSTYNFTFNKPTGQWLIILCDNSTAEINVRKTQHSKLDNITTNQSTLYLEVDSAEENQATLLDNLNKNFTWTNSSLADILADTAAMDTSSELRTLLTGSDTAVSTLTENNNIGVDLDDVVGTLDAAEIGADAITSAKIADAALSEEHIDTAFGDEIADQVWDEAMSGHTSDATFGGDFLDADVWTDTKAGYLDEAISGIDDNPWDNAARTLTAFTASWVDSECTDAAELATVQDDIKANATLETDEIITQGDSAWATATGFSTHSAANVWAVGTRDLTDYNQSLEWTYFSEINQTSYSINQTMAEQVWAYTTRTLSSFGTLVADVWGYVTRTLSSFGTLVADIDIQLNASHSTGNWSDVGLTTSQNTTLYNISISVEGKLNTTHGTGSWVGSSASEVWSAVLASGTSANTTLSEINKTVVDVNTTVYKYLIPMNDTLVKLNVTVVGQNLTASDIWSYILGSGSSANATITEINDTVYWIERLLP